MPLNPLDDVKTYRSVADAAYSRGVPAVTRKRLIAAGEAGTDTPTNPEPEAPPPGGMKFTKGFTPTEKAAQAKALTEKLKARDAQKDE